MGLYKNRKGIIHSVNENDPQIKKWIKDEQLKPLTEKEAKAYAAEKKAEIKAKSQGKKGKTKPEPAEPTTDTVEGAEDNAPDQPLSEIDQLRKKFAETFGEEPDKKWNSATLKKKLEEAAPQ